MFRVKYYVSDNQCVSFLRCSAFSLSKNGTVLFFKKERRAFFYFFGESKNWDTRFVTIAKEDFPVSPNVGK
ncbi:hypothetical protein ABID99_002883 [Mucilaginibacter sp. OAE612]